MNEERRSRARQQGKMHLVHLLYNFARPHLRLFLTSLALLPLLAAAQMAQPYVIKITIDRYIAVGDFRGVMLFSLLYLSTFLIESLLNFLHNILLSHGAQAALKQLRQRLFGHLLRLPIGYFDRNSIGVAVSRVTNDVESIHELMVAGMMSLLRDAVILVAIVAMLFHLHGRLTLITFALLPPLLLVIWWLQRKMRVAAVAIRKIVGNLNGFISESLAGISIIKIFQHEESNLAAFNKLNQENRLQTMAGVNADAALYSVVEAFASVVVAGVLWFGARQIGMNVDGLTYGTLVAFIEYLNRFFAPLKDISSTFGTMQMAIASGDRILEVLRLPEEAQTTSEPTTLKAGPMGVMLQGVELSYVNDQPVLRGIDLTLAPMEHVAIVGATGSGKTSLARLLTRLYPAQEGEIQLIQGESPSWSGTPVEALPLSVLRREIAMVPQDVELFSGSVAQNITMQFGSLPPELLEQVEQTLKGLKIDDRFQGSTPLDERGQNLSAGERQLLGLARVFFGDPRLIILDEATSNIDSLTEQKILHAMQVVLKGRTALIIAHRLSTVQHADRIVVMHQGRIESIGTHAKLLKQSPIYQRLVREYSATQTLASQSKDQGLGN